MTYITTDFLDTKSVTVYDPKRIENLIVNAELATKIESKGISIEVIFTNKGKFDGSEVTYNLPLERLNQKQIYKLLSYKRNFKDERRKKNTNYSNRVLQRYKSARH